MRGGREVVFQAEEGWVEGKTIDGQEEEKEVRLGPSVMPDPNLVFG